MLCIHWLKLLKQCSTVLCTAMKLVQYRTQIISPAQNSLGATSSPSLSRKPHFQQAFTNTKSLRLGSTGQEDSRAPAALTENLGSIPMAVHNHLNSNWKVSVALFSVLHRHQNTYDTHLNMQVKSITKILKKQPWQSSCIFEGSSMFDLLK